jgi:hypothetical protein
LPKDHRFIKRVVICDEKYIYLNNPELQKQWLDKGQLPVPVAKRKRFEKKRSSSESGGTTNSQQLEKMHMVLLEKYPALVNRKRVLLQQDNARPHMAKKLLRKSKNWKVLNSYRIPLLVLILSHQITICFVSWPSSFVVESFNL